MLFEFIGYLAGICTAVCFMPQTIKTLRTRDVKSLSLTSYIIYNLGIFSWTLYGLHLKSVQMVLFNSISLIFSLSILYMIIKYKNKKAN
ncbi:MAG: SemiSWEET transporter [Lactobacillaceae bacterium]|jgi:MtN3 and saliva related transmembrane protein|nr:SemiSWEET transporter [Lactobacillaceae bacterium]